MLILHHLNNSRSQRILWLLEELGVKYRIKRYERDPKTLLAPKALRAVHPLGKSPVLTDGKVVVAESGAIIEYLLDTYGEGRLRPAANTAERLRFQYWLHYAEGSVMPLLYLWLVFSRMSQSPTPLVMRPVMAGVSLAVTKTYINPQLKTHFDYMEAELGKFPWFAGREFSAADIQMSFPLEAGFSRVGLNENRPHLEAFLRKVQARPAYQRALKKGGPYDYAPQFEGPGSTT